MSLTKILIAVKTYPTLSGKYDELVCTAGFREDGTWVRIYPIPFRQLDYGQQYKKYDWVEFDLEKSNDFRSESFKLRTMESDFKIIEHIGTEDNWKHRKNIVLKNVHLNMTDLITAAKNKNKYTSLAVFKPKEVLEFKTENTDREWDKEKLAQLKAHSQQFDLFKNSENKFEVVQKLPYKFSYRFTSEDNKERTLMIEDWEIGALYWNSLKRHEGNEHKACEDVKKKYFDDFAKTKDLYLFLGTTKVHHLISPNPFIIIGTFHPKRITQLSFDF